LVSDSKILVAIIIDHGSVSFGDNEIQPGWHSQEMATSVDYVIHIGLNREVEISILGGWSVVKDGSRPIIPIIFNVIPFGGIALSISVMGDLVIVHASKELIILHEEDAIISGR